VTSVAVEVAAARELADRAVRAAADLELAADEAAQLLARAGVSVRAPARLAAAGAWTRGAGRRIDRLVDDVVAADQAFGVSVARDGRTVRLRVRLSPGASREEVFALLGALGHGDGRPPDSPAAARRLIEGLPPALALRLADRAPQVIGRLDGAPAHLRHRANRVLIREDRARLRADLVPVLADAQAIAAHARQLLGDPDDLDALLATAPERLTAVQARRLIDLAERIPALWWPPDLRSARDGGSPDLRWAAEARTRVDRLGELLADPALTILVYDGTGQGRLAVALGDVESAATVSTLIPGTGTTLDRLHAGSDYRRSLRNLHRELGEGHAAVLWFDFDAPDSVLPGAARSRYADDAALRLPAFTEGLATGGGSPRQVVFGHSYGGVVLATAGPDLRAVDTVVALGAPGLRVLGTQAPPFPDGTRVVAATYPRDPILYATIVPRWGIDPVQHRDIDVVDLTTIDQSGKGPGQRHMDYLLDDVSVAMFAALVRGEDIALRRAGSSGDP
jgi:hypothetical protein